MPRESDLEPGATFDGRYRLRRLLRDGAAGPVWEAELVGGGPPVALEILEAYPSRADEEARQRAARTIRSVAWPWFRHPNAAAMLRFGGDRMPPYAASEPPAGETVRDRLQRSGPMVPDEAARVVADVAEAVHAAHEVGVAHGAIGPDVVVVTEDGGGQLLDLGLARRSWERSAPRVGVGGRTTHPAFAAATTEDVAALAALLQTMTRNGADSRHNGGASAPPARLTTVTAAGSARELASELRAATGATPAGTRVPAARPAGPPVASPDHAPASVAPRRWRMFAVAALVLAVAGIAALLLVRTPSRTAAPEGGASAPGSATRAAPSLPPGTVSVPELRGLSAAEAERALLDAGLTLSTVRPVEGTPGTVVRTEPGTGAVVARGSSVALLVGAEAGRIPSSAGP